MCFICGTSILPREEVEFERQTRSGDSFPRKSRSSKASKNPYSTRGLDKFTALLAEIEEKRQQIYSQLDPNEISMVRFVYSSDHNFKPIVVKVKPKPENNELKSNHGKNITKLPSSSSMALVKENKKSENICKKKMGFFRDLRVYQINTPRFYLPMILILILVFLVLFGRSFAIICTSIGWYVIPTITNNNGNNNSSNMRMSFKKKDHVTLRRLSDKKLMTSEGTTSFKNSI